MAGQIGGNLSYLRHYMEYTTYYTLHILLIPIGLVNIFRVVLVFSRVKVKAKES